MIVTRILASIAAALVIGSTYSAAWLIWQGKHCRTVPAHAYYTPMERCGH